MRSRTAPLAALAAGTLVLAPGLAGTPALASARIASASVHVRATLTRKSAAPTRAELARKTATPTHKADASPTHTLLQSRELWATIDVCSPADQPDTVGVRGSMPGDGHAKDTMYMSFQLQYLEAKGNTWVDLHDGDSTFIAIGSAKAARQGGWSVQLKPAAGQPADTIRGVVTFQWRHEGRVAHETTRTTQAGHKSLADADPPDYTAAECTIP